MPAELRREVQRGLEAALRDGDIRRQIEYRLHDKNGKIVNVEARLTPVEYQTRPALLLALRDITERRAAARCSSANLASMLSSAGAALLELSQAITSTLDLTEVLKIITTRTAAACGADRCSLFRWTAEGRIEPIMSQFASGLPDRQLWLAFKKLDRYRLEDVPAFADVVDQLEPVVIDDPEGSALLPREWVETFHLRSVLVVALVRHDRVVGVLQLDNTHQRRLFDAGQIQLASTIANLVVLAIENARLFQETQRRLQESEKGASELAALIKGNTLITSRLNLDQVLDGIVTVAAELTGLPQWIVMLANGNQELVGKSVIRGPEEIQEIGRLEIGKSLFGLLAEEEGSLVVEDMTSDARFLFRHLARRYGLQACLGLPMRAKDRLVGVLATFTKEPHRFSAREIKLLTALADQAAIAIENAKLHSKVKELAVHRERNRLARTLHDSLAQTLFSVGLDLDWCLHRLSGNLKVVRRIRTAKQDVGAVLADVRNLIHEFSKEDTRRKADPDTILRSLIADFQRRSGLRAQLCSRGALASLDPGVLTVVYHCIHEAMVNVVKHAQATRARITVEVLDTGLRFQVEDDGVGRADELVARVGAAQGCFGLRQMHQRLAEVGGSLLIEDNTPVGLRLSGTLPIPVRPPDHAR